jgi:hypothetical protein
MSSLGTVTSCVGGEGFDADGFASVVEVSGIFYWPRDRATADHVRDLGSVALGPAFIDGESVLEEGEILGIGTAGVDRFAQQVDSDPLDIELSVGVLGHDPRRVCGVKADALCCWPTMVMEDGSEAISVPDEHLSLLAPVFDRDWPGGTTARSGYDVLLLGGHREKFRSEC